MFKKFLFSLTIFFVALQSVRCVELEAQYKGNIATKQFVELSSIEGAGMFFCMICTIGALDFFERGWYAGVRVSYGINGKYGVYHDPLMGPNWWEYYFEPLNAGSDKNAIKWVTVNGKPGVIFSLHVLNKMNKSRISGLVQKYVHVKPHIQAIVEAEVAEQFGTDFIIGVHYRGTDKAREAPRVSYENVVEAVSQAIVSLEHENYKIFVATDEQGFVEHMQNLYPGKVIFYDATRSTDGKPVHLGSSTPYKAGEDALVDCLLLSKCSTLIRTTSYLSYMTEMFNPNLPVKLVKQRY